MADIVNAVSIVVPNHNGRDLLSENLPAVVGMVPGRWDVEVIVVDDASTDGSVEFVRKAFPQVRVLALPENLGFGEACNLGVAACRAEVVVLLNTDMSPRPGYLPPLVEHFADSCVFAVMAQQSVPEETRTVYRGRTTGTFERGFFRHEYSVSDSPVEGGCQPAFYAPGGGSAFSRDKYLEIGGFDDLFTPFYWEDVDLSLRAWRRGLRVLFEPASTIVHPWSRTIYRQNALWNIRSTSARNSWLMVWKNALDRSFITANIAAMVPSLMLNAARGNSYAVAGFIGAVRRWPIARARRAIEKRERTRSDRAILELAAQPV